MTKHTTPTTKAVGHRADPSSKTGPAGAKVGNLPDPATPVPTPAATKAPARRRNRDDDLVFVPGVGTTLPAKAAKPAAKKAAPKPAAKKAAAKPAAKKVAPKAAAKPAPKKAAAKAAAKGSTFDLDAVLARIKALRADGQSWRVLSDSLNAEGVTTVRGKSFGSNGSTAFLIAKKAGIK